MESLRSILVVLNRDIADQALIGKAVMIAGHSGARIELFSCDAEVAYALRRSYDERDAESAEKLALSAMREYLGQMRDEIAAQGLKVSIDAVCHSPLYEGVVYKVLASRPDLVLKSAANELAGGHSALGSNDWQLVRTCPAPLLLSRGRVWPSHPRFAAVVDVSDQETPGLAASILRTTQYLGGACSGAEIEMIFGEKVSAEHDHHAHAVALRGLGESAHMDANRIRLVPGDPSIALPAIARSQCYDVLVVGALTHQPRVRKLVGSLTRQLMEALDSDFVLVRPNSSGFATRRRWTEADAQPHEGR